MFFGQNPFSKEFMDVMEKMFVEKINDAIRDPSFLNHFGQVVGAGLDGKKKMDEASRTYLEKLNMPTRDDVARILQYLQQIENRLIATEEKVEAVQDVLAQKGDRPAERKTAKPEVKKTRAAKSAATKGKGKGK